MGWQQGSVSFPASPTIGQTHDHTGKTYQWNGVGWRQITPSYETVHPVGLELLAAGSANNVATLDFVLTSSTAYRGFLWRMQRFVPITDAVTLLCRVSTDGGVTFDAAAASYDWAVGQVDSDAAAQTAAGGSGSDVSITIGGGAQVGNGTTEGVAFWLQLWKPTSTALWNRLTYNGYYITSAATPVGRVSFGGGARETAQDTDALRFLFSSGNIASVDYSLYGWL